MAQLGEKDKELIREVIREYMRTGAFTDRKVSDIPSDALSLVNRKYVTLNGATASRPSSSVLGQIYFDTTLGKPVWWDGSKFVDATGTAA